MMIARPTEVFALVPQCLKRRSIAEPDDLGRRASHDCQLRHFPSDDGTGRNHGTESNPHPGHDHRTISNPDALPDFNALLDSVLVVRKLGRTLDSVIFQDNAYVLPKVRVASDNEPSPSPDHQAGIDAHVVPKYGPRGIVEPQRALDDAASTNRLQVLELKSDFLRVHPPRGWTNDQPANGAIDQSMHDQIFS
jgi:hypothetical protein